jgi:hypothetical protein
VVNGVWGSQVKDIVRDQILRRTDRSSSHLDTLHSLTGHRCLAHHELRKMSLEGHSWLRQSAISLDDGIFSISIGEIEYVILHLPIPYWTCVSYELLNPTI